MKMKDTDAINNILSRTSDRSFDKNIPLTDDEISAILHAAMSAPTAVNRRPWHFVVVRNRTLLDRLADALPYCQSARQAPLAIVVCGDSSRFLSGDDSTLWVQDLSASSENILLAAHALGLGAVWTSVYPHSDRMKSVGAILSLPDTLRPFNVIPIGHVNRTHRPLDKWNPGNITYM